MPTPEPQPTTLDVFVSYAREDRPTASNLAAALQARGISVWWDREILGGTEFSAVIEQELNRARVALVLWSENAVRSSFVRDESARALAADKLLPVRIEAVAPPLGFGQIHTLDLLDWQGEGDAPALTELVAHIQRRLRGGTGPLPTDAPRGRVASITRRALVAGSAAMVAAGVAWFSWLHWSAPDTARAQQLTAQGLENFEKKEFGQARFRFNQALDADRDYAPALFYRAQVLVQSGAPAEASADLKRVLELQRGLDAAQLRDAARWHDELVATAAEPVPVTRAAGADTGVITPTAPPIEKPAAAATPASPAASDVTVVKPEPAERHSLPPNAAALAKLNATVEQMFSPTKDVRLAATTSLIVDPDMVSDAVPLGVRRALQAQRDGVPKDPAELSGVINVLVLMQSATPGTLALHSDEIGRLLEAARNNGPQTTALATPLAATLAKAQTQSPVVFIQIASEAQRKLASALAARLRAAGYRVPAAEVVGTRAPARVEIRAHGRSDRSLARWMVKVGQELTGTPIAIQTLRNAKPKEDTFEIWLDAALCVAPDRRPAACGA
jgi:tetratricopeptide (TPR) repeat protein